MEASATQSAPVKPFLERVMQKLKGRELTARIREMLGDGHKQADIAKLLGTTQPNVSRVAKKIESTSGLFSDWCGFDSFRIAVRKFTSGELSPIEFMMIPAVHKMVHEHSIDYFLVKAGCSPGETLEFFFERYYKHKFIHEQGEGR